VLDQQHRLALAVEAEDVVLHLVDSSCWSTAWHGDGDPLHLVAEVKGYSREDATCVDNLGTFGRWRSPR